MNVSHRIQIFKQAVFLKYSADLLMLHTGNRSFIRLLQPHFAAGNGAGRH